MVNRLRKDVTVAEVEEILNELRECTGPHSIFPMTQVPDRPLVEPWANVRHIPIEQFRCAHLPRYEPSVFVSFWESTRHGYCIVLGLVACSMCKKGR